MKKMFVFLMMCMVMSIAAYAQTEVLSEKMIAPPQDGGSGFGQNQFYSVIFDEEGDAIVAAKLKIQNTGKENLTWINIEIPGESIRVVNLLQEVQEQQKVCSYWEKICVDYDEREEVCRDFKERCANWYWQPIWPPFYYTVGYNEVPLSKSSSYTLIFPRPIKEQETGTFLIYYKVNGYVEKSLGVFDFDFETVKMNQDVNEVRVSVNVQDGLYMEGGEAKVDYRSSFAVAEKAMAAGDGVQSQDLNAFSSQIEYQSGYVKTAQGLDPLESFHVKGEYSTSWFNLHKWSILIGILAAMAIIYGLYSGLKKFARSKKESMLMTFGIGAGAAVLLVLSWVFFWFVMRNINGWIGWQYSQLINLLMVLLMAIVTLALLVGPALYVGFTKNVKEAFIIAGTEIVVLVVLSIIAVILLAVLNQGQNPIIYRAMGAMAESLAVK